MAGVWEGESGQTALTGQAGLPGLAPVWGHFLPQNPTSLPSAPSSVPWQRARGHPPGEKCPAQHSGAGLGLQTPVPLLRPWNFLI